MVTPAGQPCVRRVQLTKLELKLGAGCRFGHDTAEYLSSAAPNMPGACPLQGTCTAGRPTVALECTCTAAARGFMPAPANAKQKTSAGLTCRWAQSHSNLTPEQAALLAEHLPQRLLGVPAPSADSAQLPVRLHALCG